MYTFNLSGICVLCLNDNDNLRSLLHDNSDISLINKIEFLISSDLLLLLPDNPECICSTCNRKLNSFYTFKQMCLENGRRLKYYMKRKLETAINRSSSKNISDEFEQDEYLRITGITEKEIADSHFSDENFTLYIDDDDDEEPVTSNSNEENAEFVKENSQDDKNNPVSNEAEVLPKNKDADQSICDDTQKNNAEIIDLSMCENIDIKEEFIEVSDDDNRNIYNNYLRDFDSDISEENQNLNSAVDENITRYSEFRGTVDNEICHSSISESNDNSFQSLMKQSELENMTNESVVNKQLLLDTVNNKTIKSNVSKAPVDMIMEKKTKNSELDMQGLINTIITESLNTSESNSNSVLKITTKENTETTRSNVSQNTKDVDKNFFLETVKNKNYEFKISKSPENKDNTIKEIKINKRLRLDTTTTDIYDFNHSDSSENIVLHNSTEESDTNEEFKFPCTLCNKSYRKKGHFTRHLKTHSEIQPPKTFYKCDVCQRNFQRKPNLKRHMDTHSERTSVCVICDLIFLETNMEEHLKQHRYKCRKYEEAKVENVSTEDVNVKTVNTEKGNPEEEKIQKGNVVKAKAEKINLEVFKCTVCQHEFNRKSSLVNHLRSHMDKKIKIKMFASRKRLREWE